MYLATLERIRKIIDEVNAEGGGLQVLLAGRKSLGANLEQLALCNFEKISEKQFFLSALDDNETWNYLNFCVQGFRGNDQQEVFTKEASAKISSMGRGNLRLINMYAEESLQSSNADTSFLVLLDHVKDDGSGADLLSSTPGFLARLPLQPRYIAGGLAAGVVLLLIVLFSGDDEKKSAEFMLDQPNSSPVFSGKNTSIQSGSSEKPTAIVSESVVAKDVVQPIIVETSEAEPDVVRLREIELVEVTGKSQESVSYTPVEISPVEIVEKLQMTPRCLNLKRQVKFPQIKVSVLSAPVLPMITRKKTGGAISFSSNSGCFFPIVKRSCSGKIFYRWEKMADRRNKFKF